MSRCLRRGCRRQWLLAQIGIGAFSLALTASPSLSHPAGHLQQPDRLTTCRLSVCRDHRTAAGISLKTIISHATVYSVTICRNGGRPTERAEVCSEHFRCRYPRKGRPFVPQRKQNSGTWSEVKLKVAEMSHKDLVKLIGDLYRLSRENQAFPEPGFRSARTHLPRTRRQ